MKSKKLNLSLVILWGVVAYAIALLTYCTMNNFFHSSADDISAFGSILGACGAFFAAFVATYLFNDWKEQQKHQNSIQFGIEVYASFKKFDEYFSEICKELTFLEYELKEVLKNNDNNLRSAFLINSSKISKRNHELFNHYLNFQNSYTNYCIVTNQEDLLIDMEQTRDSLLKFYRVLTEIQYENSLEVKLQKILFLNSEPVNQIGIYIYNYYIKMILKKLCL
ncbi:hypothetical protein Q5M52_10700 [Acinetobacter nosocomialis]|uniref:hypothetical protein n=1 Tax=Acinetobacter nosocomialis TaxID=106654 RepID=UPI0026F64E55|nr:hypothetical protein [Acinetobacter nosocomialis]MDO7539729.1 hypothetical protein [Acinetobacter nosocomialis]